MNRIHVVVLMLLLTVAVASSFRQRMVVGPATQSRIDPVNDPAYNVRQTAIQCVLLEQHLSDAAKYCHSCIVKHFMLCIGLLQEAVWMSPKGSTHLPFLRDSDRMFCASFDRWLARRDSEDVRMTVLEALRGWRRAAIDAYFLQPSSTSAKSSCGCKA
jgi:hypothetical protein